MSAAAPKKAASPVKSAPVIKVVAPLVQIRVGDRIVHLFRDDVVPDGVDADSLAHLVDLGYVTKGDEPESDGDK